MSRIPRAAACLLVAATLVACTATEPGDDPVVPTTPEREPADLPQVPAELAAYYEQELAWEDCGAGADCTDVTVPMDYADPDGQAITIAVKRRAASGDEVVGSLFLNPGGPGGSGIDLVEAVPMMFSRDLLDGYDVVGFDPRGVGSSTAVDCVSDAELDELRAESFDTDGEALARFSESAEQLAQACTENTGALLAHVDTVSAARDLDVLRHVLGAPQLNYLGYSYGTFLGATYAETFPEHVGRMVLDGGLDPALGSSDLVRGQAAGFERAIRVYAEDCLDGSDCPLSDDVDTAVGQIQSLLQLAERTPLPTGTERDLTAPLMFSGLIMPLYDDTYWMLLTSALTAAIDQGDGSQLLLLADLAADREVDGTYRSNSVEANIAINCLDYPVVGEVEDWRTEAKELEQLSPTFGAALSYGELTCSAWPHESERTPAAVTATGAPPIVVIGTTGDPATPYEWSEALAAQLDSGVLVTYEGEGHTAYGRAGQCITTAVDDFLLSGTAPDDGLVC